MMSSPAAPLQSVRSGGAPDREGLNVPVLAAIGVGGCAELDLEGDVFAKIAIRVEAKGVETFVAEGVGRADAGVRIHGQSHHRCARAAAKQVEVADVNAGVFFCRRRIEMMRHGESSPKLSRSATCRVAPHTLRLTEEAAPLGDDDRFDARGQSAPTARPRAGGPDGLAESPRRMLLEPARPHPSRMV